MNEVPTERSPEGSTDSTPEANAAAPAPSVAQGPVGLIAPEWSLRRSAKGAALWRHAGVLSLTRDTTVEVIALDRVSQGRPFVSRDEWNAPAPTARYRVRRVKAGPRTREFGPIDRARLEGKVLDWAAERKPRVAHVLDLEPYGAGVLLALDTIGVPTVLSIDRPDVLLTPESDPDAYAQQCEALSVVRRIIVRSTGDASAVERAGAPRASVRVINSDRGDDQSVLRAYASLYRLLAPAASAASAA